MCSTSPVFTVNADTKKLKQTCQQSNFTRNTVRLESSIGTFITALQEETELGIGYWGEEISSLFLVLGLDEEGHFVASLAAS
jgi:hypothetical protein